MMSQSETTESGATEPGTTEPDSSVSVRSVRAGEVPDRVLVVGSLHGVQVGAVLAVASMIDIALDGLVGP